MLVITRSHALVQLNFIEQPSRDRSWTENHTKTPSTVCLHSKYVCYARVAVSYAMRLGERILVVSVLARARKCISLSRMYLRINVTRSFWPHRQIYIIYLYSWICVVLWILEEFNRGKESHTFFISIKFFSSRNVIARSKDCH